MNRRIVANLLLVVASLLCTLGVVEVVMRAVGVADADGNVVVGHRPLRPWRLPILTTKQKIEAYQRAGPRAVEIYDPTSPRTTRCESFPWVELRRTRVAHESSAIHSDEVPFEQSFGYQLERKLNADGYVAEVLNFGVPGFGTDQAFLRWRRHGKGLSPQIVIVGIYPDDVRRNVNLIRPLCAPTTGIPFSKPRFIVAPVRGATPAALPKKSLPGSGSRKSAGFGRGQGHNFTDEKPGCSTHGAVRQTTVDRFDQLVDGDGAADVEVEGAAVARGLCS